MHWLGNSRKNQGVCYNLAMRAALYVKGEVGNKVYDHISGFADVDVICVCEDKIVGHGASPLVFAASPEHATGIELVSLEELQKLYGTGLIDAVIVATENEFLDYVIKRLSGLGINNISIVPSYYGEALELSDDSFIWIETDKPRMPYLEYHISFQCNLKCAGCTHFSNIFPGERFGDLNKFCDDMLRLQELFWGIGKIRLMGGEPVLNKELPQFIYAARGAFPDADIRVVSNGLMLRTEHTELFNAMRDNAVFFDVSMYPPTKGSISNIARFCEQNGVRLTVTPDITEFTAGMNLNGKSDPEESYKNCPASHCAYLCEGKISTCAMPQLIDIYNDRYGTDIHSGEYDIVDIYDESLDGYRLLERLKSPMEICRYCDPERRSYAWFVSPEPLPAEWLSKV